MEDYESGLLGENRREHRRARKLASRLDRSKYKKTDEAKRAKREVKASGSSLKRGRVLAISSKGIEVDEEGKAWLCWLRGAMKKEKGQEKNLVAVGDFVLFEESSMGEGFIHGVEARHSVLARADNLSRRKQQIIAANIDQVLITVSVCLPTLNPAVVDRYIIATKKGAMEPVVVVNKIDLLREDDRAFFEEFLEAYRQAQIVVIPVSAETGEGLEALREAMKGKASVFSGPSGVGKSSLINAVTGLELPVGDVVLKTRKGAHTTTKAHLITLSFGGWCVDTPGVRSFGIWKLDLEEIKDYFSEMVPYARECKYPDCLHTVEEGCAIRQAVEEGVLSPLRYHSYLSLIESSRQRHLRR